MKEEVKDDASASVSDGGAGAAEEGAGASAFLSTPLGREPGGEYTHISRTLGGQRVAFIGAWLKIISYVGAGAYLASALADYVIEFAGGRLSPETYKLPLALAGLVFFYLVHTD